MKNFALFVFLFSITFLLNAQTNDYDNHILNDPLYRDIVKHHLKVSDQNINDAIVIDNFLITLRKTKGTSAKLNPYTSINLPSTSPEELIRSYAYKMSELEAVCNNIRTEIDMRLDRDIDNFLKIAERALKELDIKYSTGNAELDRLGKNWAKARAKKAILKTKEEDIAKAKREAERELKYEIESKLRPVRDQMLRENKEWMEQSLYAAAYAPELAEEKKHLKEYEQYKCNYDYVDRNYSYQSTKWLKPPCGSSSAFNYQDYSSDDNDLAKIAIRKYELFKKYHEDIFKEATTIYLQQALGQNPKNADLLVLTYNLEEDVIEKYNAIMVAHLLDKKNMDIEYKYESYKKTFTSKLKSSIDYRDIDFINKSFEKGLIADIKIDNVSPLEYCIKTDNANMMDLLIKKYKIPAKEINYLQVPVVMYGAKQCLSLLNRNYQVDNSMPFKNQKYITLLNIALLNQKEEIAEKMISNRNVINSLVYASKYLSKTELDNLCDFLYDNDKNYLTQIKKYSPNYDPTAYKINIKVLNFETADIYYNKEKIGRGSASIGIREINQLKDIQIFGANTLNEELDAIYLIGYLSKGNNVIEVSLADKPNRLLTLEDKFQGKKDWNNFYNDPLLLPESKKQFDKPFSAIGSSILAAYSVSGIIYILAAKPFGKNQEDPDYEYSGTDKFFMLSMLTFYPSAWWSIKVAINGNYKRRNVKIKENIKKNNQRKNDNKDLAKFAAINYNKPFLEDINKSISDKNKELLSKRKIILLDKNGIQKDITPPINKSDYIL